ncbi:MAG: transglutaminase domain-containing protein [Bacteroidales bacterium]|jgi:transglutaminase-like putative cysteine protease|nr:transglutaminase domain-containing protein [Bacteroidales bacterium]
MTWIIRLPVLFFMAVLLSCSGSHLVDDNSLREAIAEDFRSRSEIHGTSRSDLFGMADTISDGALREAVTFLLAYMPLSDLAVYEPDYLAANASFALRARRELPWGKEVPAEIFLNFVLPPRVNNENPDDFRTVCYQELKDRVQGLGAMEAALEINRWCHEKVAYQAADSRTSSPLATMLSSRGRCGEESTFTVSALRAVSLPARQVYTPRWAHTDDNHAWVEFWIDGEWHYLGACEPEPVPDRGWFTEPARRAMLIHTKAYGRYSGDERIISKEKFFTEINTLGRYAETKELKVMVRDASGKPVPGAMAAYMLYNYSEFYPLATLECDSRGECSLLTGFGTLLIWADDGVRSGFIMASPTDTIAEVTIGSGIRTDPFTELLLAPPVPEPFPGIDPEQVRINDMLLKRGDSIRQSYINTWLADISAEEIASEAGLQSETVSRLLKSSMGNYRAVAGFIRGAGDRAGLAVRLLENISGKDLRDTPSDLLADHLDKAPDPAPGTDTALYDRYVLSPRISNELLSPFRTAIRDLPSDLRESFRTNPSSAAVWIDTAIVISKTENHYATPLIPAGVLRLRMADSHSRDIFFVALCRTIGIPSRLAPGTGRPQYHIKGEWHDVWFESEPGPSETPGYITFISEYPGSGSTEPQNQVNFTLARIENGRIRTLDWEYGLKINDMPARIPLDPGTLMLTTGIRDETGNVMTSVSFLDLKPGEELPVMVTIPDFPEESVAGFPVNLDYTLTTMSGDEVPLDSISGRGVVLVWIEPGKEPTRHLLNDLPELKSEFDSWGGWFVFLTHPDRTPEGFDPESVAGTPENTLFATDSGLQLLDSVAGSSRERPWPVVLYCSGSGEVLFASEGYRIGTGQQLLRKLRN